MKKKNRIQILFAANTKLSNDGQRRVQKQLRRHYLVLSAEKRGDNIAVVMDITTAIRSNDQKRRTDLMVKEVTDMVNSKLANLTQNQVREWYVPAEMYDDDVPGITIDAVPARTRSYTPELKALRRSAF